MKRALNFEDSFCGDLFQIDGNFGATSGITEMLLQSHLHDDNENSYQDILPAGLPNGKISGIRGRGGFEISIEWKNGALISVNIKSLFGNKLNLRYAGKVIIKETFANESYSFKAIVFNSFIKINAEYEKNFSLFD